MTRDVDDAFVEEDVGDIIDNDEDVDALERLRPRWFTKIGPAEWGEGDTPRPYKRPMEEEGPAFDPAVVSIARRECIA